MLAQELGRVVSDSVPHHRDQPRLVDSIAQLKDIRSNSKIRIWAFYAFHLTRICRMFTFQIQCHGPDQQCWQSG